MNRGCLLGMVLLLMLAHKSRAQSSYPLSGSIRDRSFQPIAGASVFLIYGSDTAYQISDSQGRFYFKQQLPSSFSVAVRSIGYAPVKINYELSQLAGRSQLDDILLDTLVLSLENLTVSARSDWMKLKKDTIEYKVAGYLVKEGDKLQDLLKQLPGVQIDEKKNLKIAGKAITRFKVNGRDFFTGDIKDFISKLPAGIIKDLQLVDDYGEIDNFTGIKTGEPEKILNLVTKDSADYADFKTVDMNFGSGKRYDAIADFSEWRQEKQWGLNLSSGNIGITEGITASNTLSAQYRNNIRKGLSLGVGYSLLDNINRVLTETNSETTTAMGFITERSVKEQEARGTNHALNMDIKTDGVKRTFGELSLGLNFSRNSSLQNIFLGQTGLLNQRVDSRNDVKGLKPEWSGTASFAHRLHKEKRVVSASFSFQGNRLIDKNNSLNRAVYQGVDSFTIIKDSIWAQLVDIRNKGFKIVSELTYAEPLGNKSILSFYWSFTSEKNHNSLITATGLLSAALVKIDSLSSGYRYNARWNQVGLFYKYAGDKIDFTGGFGIQLNEPKASIEDGSVYRNPQLLPAPSIKVNYILSSRSTVSANLQTSSQLPVFEQLWPFRDPRNLLNISIGNPDLRPAFTYTPSFEWQRIGSSDGSYMSAAIQANLIKDHIVIYQQLVPDALAGFRQLNSYENLNGAYNINTYFSWFRFMNKRVWSLELNGSVGFNRDILLTDKIKSRTETFSYSSAARINMNKSWLSMNAALVYQSSLNRLLPLTREDARISSWIFDLNQQWTLPGFFQVGIQASYKLSRGYSIAFPDPFVLDFSAGKKLLRSKKLSVHLSIKDIFDQRTGFSRAIAANTITDRQSNQLGRFLLIGFNFSL